MNFLSHYYFDRHCTDPNRVMGTVLPDLVKNANRKWSLHPHKKEIRMKEDTTALQLLGGWMRHLEVDRYFHSSDFFLAHTSKIRELITPALAGGEVRPSFLAHVSLELMLDGLLITESVIDTHQFYAQLQAADRAGLERFLTLSGLPDPADFQVFLEKFIASGYLHSYRDTPNIMYALNRICMRLWNDPLNEQQQAELTSVLVSYRQTLEGCFMEIFGEIAGRLA